MKRYALKDYSQENIEDLKVFLVESWKGLINEIALEKAEETIEGLQEITFTNETNITVKFDLKISGYTILSSLGISKIKH